ncbi:MAG: DegT/DnrJ/EryC1/StrS family aminotransferase [Candidatus Omnitrophica bacterium]|nr:DegT/DnrJ/EryC1/StrS family aminotransferase [Candidatus Omnitrophota bacterium]MDD5429608.1 DegT/DnrJ/EryC1/StrS family aminotransferase [Candidatus Omnitrophota bacterium]
MRNNKPIFVTKPSLAPLKEYTKILKEVWRRGVLTHNGPLVQSLEEKICRKFGLNYFVAVSNGTIALQMAIKALKLKGEIITTPFTWIATISAIKWQGCQPVFCDIDRHTLNIDPAKIESLITPLTTAILPVHVFGNPCDIEGVEAVAKKHKLKVIYDAAHAVGSTYKGKSILKYGDISAISFHATKLMNTAEGGGCVAKNRKLYEKLKCIRFFGYNDQKNMVEEGFNGKMTEVHAGLGLANLRYYNKVLSDRKHKCLYYRQKLSSLKFISFQECKTNETNYSYFPVIFDSEKRLIAVKKKLNAKRIFPRRYFFPSVNTYTKNDNYRPAPISESISKRILCLPLYWELKVDEMKKIIKLISK